jgi:hypothetical protein
VAHRRRLTDQPDDHQLDALGGDPFIGAKLGNLLQAVGYRDVTTEVKTLHVDNRSPGERAEVLGLLAAGKVTAATVDGMKNELERVGRDPNAVFFYAFVQARARVW